MKKAYQAPNVEKISFQYQDQIMDSGACQSVWVNIGESSCIDGNKQLEYLN